jgi:hypothetical protein
VWGARSEYGFVFGRVRLFGDEEISAAASQGVVVAVERQRALQTLNELASGRSAPLFPGALAVTDVRPVAADEFTVAEQLPLRLGYTDTRPSERAVLVKLLLRPSDNAAPLAGAGARGVTKIFVRVVATSLPLRGATGDKSADTEFAILRALSPLFAHSRVALLEASIVGDFEAAKRAANNRADMSELATSLRDANAALAAAGVPRAQFALAYERAATIDLDLPQARLSNVKLHTQRGAAAVRERAARDLLALAALSNSGISYDFVGVEVRAAYAGEGAETTVRYVLAVPRNSGATLIAKITEAEADPEGVLPRIGPVWPLELVDRIDAFPLGALQALGQLVLVDPALSPVEPLAPRTAQELIFTFTDRGGGGNLPYMVRVFVDRPRDSGGSLVSFAGLDAMPTVVRNIATGAMRAAVSTALGASGALASDNYTDNSIGLRSTLQATERFSGLVAAAETRSSARQVAADLDNAMIVDLRVASRLYIWPGVDSVSVAALKAVNRGMRQSTPAPDAPAESQPDDDGDNDAFLDVAPPPTNPLKRRRESEMRFAATVFEE